MINRQQWRRLVVIAGLAVSPWVSFAATVEQTPLAIGPTQKAGASLADHAAKRHHTNRYLVELKEPSAVAFRSLDQLGSIGKAIRLQPTAPEANGGQRFRADTPAVIAYREYLHAAQDRALSELSSTVGRTLASELRWDLIGNGFALTLSESEAAALRDHPLVQSVTRETVYQLQSDVGTRDIGADQVWTGTIPGSVLQTRGEGVVVGIVDSGINYGHPSFADLSPDGYNHTNPRGTRYGVCAGGTDPRCNDKLIGIYDFVNETGAQGASAGLDLGGHGTHVAATAAGNPVSGQVTALSASFPISATGVAPRANIIAYKACGEGELSCPFAATLAALNQALADGVDVINFSLGGAAQSPWGDPRAFLDLRVAGTLAAVSAGNAGPINFTVGSPANAPWVVAVANTYSSKRYTTVLGNINGTGITTPFSLGGQGISGGVAEAQVVYAGDFGDPTCTTSFPGGTFTGRIVVCDNGRSDFSIQKSLRVASAGAVGLVIANREIDGNGNAPNPFTTLPTVHVTFQDGQRLKTALRTARQGNGQIRARIDGLNVQTGGAVGTLAESSSRGPVAPFSGYLKPNIAAPGTNIVAAFQPSPTSFDVLTGTSMASPHIAGAIALLAAAHPDWTSDQLESALLTTANATVLKEDGLTPAAFYEGGAGMANIPAAMKAGLHFKVSKDAFLASNPAAGGNPESLNMPYLHSEACVSRCTFDRTVTANVGGSWSIASTGNSGFSVQAEPNAISLTAGQSVTVRITVSVTEPSAYGRWLEGTLRFTSTTDPNGVSPTVVPVSVFASGGASAFALNVTNANSAGALTMNVPIAASLAEATVKTTRMKAIVSANPVIPVDSTNDDAFDNTGQNFVRYVPLPTLGPEGNDGILYVDVRPAATQDMDLFVGFDRNDNEIPEVDELLCASTRSVGDADACLVELPALSSSRPINYWIMVQNFSSAADNPAPEINVYTSTYLEVDSNLGGVAKAMLGRTNERQELPIDFSWLLTDVAPGKKAITVIRIGADRNHAGNIVNIPVIVTRNTDAQLPPIVMNARSDTKTLSLQPGQVHERIVVDVPPNQTALVMRAEGIGGNVDLYVSKATAAPTPPVFAPAPPRNQQPFSSATASNNEVVALEGSQLTAGRYYITPVNSGTTVSTVTLSVVGEFNSNTTRAPSNGYFNPGRSGHGLFLATLPNLWAMAWYTFDFAGNPVWYTAQSSFVNETDSVWTANLFRSTWNGSRDQPQLVGKVILTQTGNGTFVFSWMVDGAYGSEPFQPIGVPQCANGNFSVGGGWLRPDQSGWGSYFLNFAGNFEGEALYVYDDLGLPRWLIGDGTYAPTLQKTFFQVSGFCPTCALVPTTRTSVGTASRTLTTANQGSFTSNLTFRNNLTGTWVQNNVDWSKLTPDLSCAP
ncbi:S8 family serine peptidase [Ahniella affigens]|nr:S8 family serine peptidase [Ahniella affigens]